jgi:hypothetical protein
MREIVRTDDLFLFCYLRNGFVDKAGCRFPAVKRQLDK